MLIGKLNNDLNKLEVTDNVDPSPVLDEDTNIVTARTVYNTLPQINDSHGYTSETTIYAPIDKGKEGFLLKSDGTNEPKWLDPKDLIIEKILTKAEQDIDGNDIIGTYAQKEFVIKAILDAMKDIIQFDYEIVESLPKTGQKGKLYLLLNSGTESNNLYDKYIWVEETSSFEKLGVNSSIINYIPVPVADGNLAVLDENGKISDSGLKFVIEDGKLKLLYDDEK